MAKNQSSSQRTKHVDVRYHFVREFVEDGIVKVKFVRSEDNKADVFTKNVRNDLNNKLTNYMYKGTNEESTD